MHRTSAAIATQALAAVCIMVDHLKVVSKMCSDHDEPISPYPQAAVTQLLDQLGSVGAQHTRPVVNDDKIIASALIFVKR